MSNARTMTIGAGCSTGSAMPPGRRSGVGGACPEAHAARLQHLLPLYGEFHGSGGFEPGSFPTWLTSVTRNLLVDHYRRSRRDRMTDALEDVLPVVEEKHSPVRTPDRAAMARELSHQVQAALSQLSPELREAVILRDLQGLEYGEI